MKRGITEIGNLVSRAIAAVLLIIVTPLLALLALCTWVSLGPPVVFRQARSGLGGKVFTMLKFRSMRDTLGEDGALLPDEERVTAFGRFLRRSRLDELPGLLNVVSGDLAFVGPRPLLPETIAHLGYWGEVRAKVRPGLTGWSQVNGNARLSLDRKIELDLWYVENETWLLRFQILFRTFSVMVFGERESEFPRGESNPCDRTSN